MRNLFDQYEQPENRLTHALASTLTHDRKLIRPFLHWLGLRNVPCLVDLRVTEQHVPGEEAGVDEGEASGLPDMCVFDDEGWAVLFEVKVQSKVVVGQLRRHLTTAKRHGYENVQLIVIAVDSKPGRLPQGVHQVEWREVYRWFRARVTRSFWASQFTQYLHAFESRMIAQDYAIRGTITMFDGFHFDTDNPYTYREGKRLIRLMGDEFRKRKDLLRIGMDPDSEGRKAITGRGRDSVWDFLPLKIACKAELFTHHPHFTMAIARVGPSAAVTVPNGVKGGFKRKLRDLGADGFNEMMLRIYKRLKPVLHQSKGAAPTAYALQRHYPSQRSGGIRDGRLDVDLRTLVPGGAEGVKYQPQWIEAIYSLLTEKRSNIQFGVSIEFSYSCKRIQSPQALDLYAKAWIAISPLINFVVDWD